MNKIFSTSIILMLFLCGQLVAQNNLAGYDIDKKQAFINKAPSKCSPYTLLLLHQARFQKKSGKSFSEKERDNFMIRSLNGREYVSGLIKLRPNIDVSKLEAKGVIVGTKAGNILSVKVPIDILELLVSDEGLEYFQIDEPVPFKLQSALNETQVNKVQKGEGLLLPVKGEDVVVGVVDFGFDYTHPSFYSSDGQFYRIKRVWIQGASGNPPSGFGYGAEYLDEQQILGRAYDINTSSHGTHVASIVAGSGFMNDQYTGVAPASEIVMVSPQNSSQGEFINTGQSNIVDAVNYIFEYASSVHKPAVVNLSLGTHLGPHDGTSLFDQAIDNLVGTGKIVVGAVGNEGMLDMHIQNDFSERGSFCTFFNYNGAGITGFVDSWGEPGMDYCISVSLVSSITGSVIDETQIVCASDNGDEEFELFQNGSSIGATIYLFSSPSEFNGKPRVLIYYENLSGQLLRLNSFGENGTMNMWNVGNGSGAHFIGAGNSIGGNNHYTMGEIGGTGKQIISAGAYVSQSSYTNLSGNHINQNAVIGEIADFSSMGPTVDGRIKPDLAAPGKTLIAAVNSYDNTYRQSSNNVVDMVYFEDRPYVYAAFEGSSMSSPMVAGMVALMLEVNPLLDPEMSKSIVQQTAKVDGFTGGVPNNTWGFGKMDALPAVRETALVTSVVSQKNIDGNNLFEVYPNPSTGNLNIHALDKMAGDIQITLFNPQGKMVSSSALVRNNNERHWEYTFPSLGNGIYMLMISCGEKTEHKKIMIHFK